MTVIHVEVNETWISDEQVCFVCARLSRKQRMYFYEKPEILLTF